MENSEPRNSSDKRKPLSVINNNSQGSKTTNNYNAISTFNNISSANSSTLAANIENSILKKLSIKFDSIISEISKTLDNLVDSKV